MLNAYLRVAIPPIVEEHGGEIDRLIGDAIMATWGTRGDQPDHAQRAVRAALAVQRETSAIADQHPGWPRFRAGVNTGEALVGVLGAESGRSYTVIGDTVNLAARLESHAPAGRVVIGPATLRAIPGLRVESLGGVRVKGRGEPVDAYLVDDASARRRRPDGDRHPRHGAEAVVVVREAHVPHPRGAAAVDRRALRVHDALPGRPEEARAVRLADARRSPPRRPPCAWWPRPSTPRARRRRRRARGPAAAARAARPRSAPGSAPGSPRATRSRARRRGCRAPGSRQPASPYRRAHYSSPGNGHFRPAFARPAGDRRARAAAGEDLRGALRDAESPRAARARARARRARGARPGERSRRRGGLARPARRLRARPAVRARGHGDEGPPAPLRGRAQLDALAARLARAALRGRQRCRRSRRASAAGPPGARQRSAPSVPRAAAGWRPRATR